MIHYRAPAEITRVAVVGAGLIGAGWVAAFLAAGRDVAVHDMAPGADHRDAGDLGRRAIVDHRLKSP